MGDTSHLERMGRELKCPICLSLVDSAVSLTCNHVFCNSCIEKSMKSTSVCPVCKVPFRRREIRPAPHMDNLVGIYKSMEVASGVNIFVTQNATSTQTPGKEDQPHGDKISDIQGTSAIQQRQKRCRRNGGARYLKANPSNSCLGTVKPSFPTKKRVHVPQYPPSETPTQCAKLTNEADEMARSETERNSGKQKDKPFFNEKGEPVFTPFFWLRDEEDGEKITQQTDVDLIMETPPDVPCFSDIKDSDDEIPSKMTPNRETCIVSSDADYFDIEMFEWTQRACSPELHTSPVRMQVEDTTDDVFQEKTGCISPEGTKVLKSGIDKREIIINGKETDSADSSSLRNKIVSSGNWKSGKTVTKAVEKSQNKRAKRTINKAPRVLKEPQKVAAQNKRAKRTITEASGAPKESGKVTGQNKRSKRTNSEASEAPKESEKLTDQNMQEDKSDNHGNASDKIHYSCKQTKELEFDANATGTAAEKISSVSGQVITFIQGNNDVFADSTALSKSATKKKSGKGSTSKNSIKVSSKVFPLQKYGSKSKGTKLKAVEDSMIQNESEVLISRSPKKSSPDEKPAFNKGAIIRKCEVNRTRKKEELKRVRFSEDSKSKDSLVDTSQPRGTKGKVDTQKLRKLQQDPNNGDTNNSFKMDDLPSLSKCFEDRSETSSNNILCAFCRSAEESEATGAMLHYLEGKLVAGDQIGGQNVIHSHKKCTEWAPNVFFQDDNAINLESELTRSRRITCSFCGIKGAALGCYKKSCRKSFHIPCAKMTPECRWDNDNFVMLCPLHAHCKLPCELHESHSNQQRKSVPNRPSPIHQPGLVKEDSKAHLQWKPQKKSKSLVLCCSGLTDPEKETISKFERLSGARVLKNWDLSVTHIIASTDENGACKRTLKYLMGVLEGKWIVTIEWVKGCMNSAELVDERHYEIEVDVHGIRNGPSLGRLRQLNMEPKLFERFKFYFLGEFVPSYKRYLHDLVIAAGGTVLHRKPISGDQENFLSGSCASTTYIIYSRELPERCEPSKINSIFNCRRLDAEAIASSTGATVASNSWILNSIAGSKLQNLTE